MFYLSIIIIYDKIPVSYYVFDFLDAPKENFTSKIHSAS